VITHGTSWITDPLYKSISEAFGQGQRQRPVALTEPQRQAEPGATAQLHDDNCSETAVRLAENTASAMGIKCEFSEAHVDS
jgi:hypothetical protein